MTTNCETGLGIVDLRNALRTTLSAWKAWRVDFPAAWFAIKQRLSGMTENYLSFDQFRAICRNLGESDTGAHDTLACYLHDLGIALHYKDDLRLCNTQVLKPAWVTGGVYRILSATAWRAEQANCTSTTCPRSCPPTATRVGCTCSYST